MAKTDLTAQRLRELLHYDQQTGLFTRRISRRGWKAGQLVGCEVRKTGYVVIGLDSSRFFAHRLSWLYVYGEWPSAKLDHINGIRSDNRIENLRVASDSVNSQNQRKARKDNRSSGLLGVTWHAPTKKWRAKLKIGSKYVHAGLHDTPEQAQQAYIEAKRIHHEGCTL